MPDAGDGRIANRSELPNSWYRAPLDSLGFWYGGGTPSKSEARYWINGTVPWVSPKDMKTPQITSSEDRITKSALAASAVELVPAESVLMVVRSGILRHTFPVATNRVDVTLNQDMKALKPHVPIEPDYVRYALTWLEDHVLHECSKDGTTVQSIKTDALKKLEIPIAPATEQGRIVAKIDELFSDIEEGERCLARAKALLKQYRQSVLKAAVTGELTRDWRAKSKGKGETGADLLRRILKARREAWDKAGGDGQYIEPMPPDTLNFPHLPLGWTWASVDQLCGQFRNGLSRKPNETPPGIPILRISAVRPMSVDPSDIRYYPDDGAEGIARYWVQTDDLLFTRYNGSQRLVGVCGRFTGAAPLLHPDKLMRARVADALLSLPPFLEIAANSGVTRQFIDSRIKTTAGQHGISGTDVKAAPIPLPPPEEQRLIVSRATEALESNIRLTSEIDHQGAMSASLRQSILRAAFSGKLVPQDPADEPASALLQRIAAERAAAPAAKPRGRRR